MPGKICARFRGAPGDRAYNRAESSMAGYESPSPSHPEARGGDHFPSSVPPSDDVAFFERLEAVESAVREVGGILTQQLPRRLVQESDAHRAHLADLARELGSAFRQLLEDVEGLRDGMQAELAGVEERLSASVSGTAASSDAGLTERLDDLNRGLSARIEDGVKAMRADAEEQAAALRGELEVLRSLPEAMAEPFAAVRDAVAEIAAAHEAIEDRLEVVAEAASGEALRIRVDETTEALAAQLGDAVGNLRREFLDVSTTLREGLGALSGVVEAARADAQERASSLQAGLERVDNLAEAVESIGRRRSFRQVVESDDRLRAEQEAMTARLSEAGGRLSGRLDEVKSELEGLRKSAHDAQAGLLAEEIRRRVVDELVTEEMVNEMLERLREGFDRRFEELLARVDARLEEMATAPTRRGLFRRARGRA
jgi:hypothetical protein